MGIFPRTGGAGQRLRLKIGEGGEGEGGRESGKERQVKKGAAREEQKSRRLRGYRHANTADFLVACVELPLRMATKKQRAW